MVQTTCTSSDRGNERTADKRFRSPMIDINIETLCLHKSASFNKFALRFIVQVDSYNPSQNSYVDKLPAAVPSTQSNVAKQPVWTTLFPCWS